MGLVDFSLAGRAAIVTGGSKGIGFAIAQAFAQHGADVAIAARNPGDLARAEKTLAGSGRRVLAVACDVTDEADRTRLVGEVQEAFGGVDILVNNAAWLAWGPLEKERRERFLEAMDCNVWSSLHLAQLCRPSMRSRGGGRIIHIASNQAIRPDLGIGVYALTKAALLNLTQLLAKEWAPDGIRVTCIAPGLVRTDLVAQRVAEVEATGAPINPLMRVSEPEEIAGLALYLASPAGAMANGTTYVVDGGELASGPEDGVTLKSGVAAAGKADL